jgi:MFS family permease
MMTSSLSEADHRAFESNIPKAYLFHFLINFQLWWSIWVIYLSEMRGLSLSQITILDAVYAAGAIVLAVPAGTLADRFGRRPALVIGSVAFTIAVLVFGLAQDYPVIFLSYVLWSFAIAFLPGAQHAILFESLRTLGREHEYQRAAGVQQAIFSFAVLAGGLAGAPIAALTDLSVPVLISAAIAMPAVAVALWLREPPAVREGHRPSYRDQLIDSARTARDVPGVGPMLLFSSLAAALTLGALLVFMQPLLARHNVNVGLYGMLQMPVRAVSMIGALGAHLVSQTFGTRAVLLATPLALGGAFALMGAVDSVYAFAAFLVVALFSQMLVPITTDYLNRRIPSEQRATILSTREMLMNFWSIWLIPLLGFIADQNSLLAAFWLLSGVSLTGLGLFVLLWLRADGRATERAAVARAPGG